MGDAEREAVIASIASSIFRTMIDDMAFDASLQAHKEVTRSRSICKICHMQCQAEHGPGSHTVTSDMASIPGTPSSRNGAASGTRATTKDVYFDCMVCKKSMASNRYAPHLATCMGLGNGTRRNASRNALSKAKIGSPPRSQSPYVENVTAPAEAATNGASHSKGKGKGKKKMSKAAMAAAAAAAAAANASASANLSISGINDNNKRQSHISPKPSPTKNTKKQKLSGSLDSGSANGHRRASPSPANMLLHRTSSQQTKIPSRLGIVSPTPGSSPTGSFYSAGEINSHSRSGSTVSTTAAAPSPHPILPVKGTGPPRRVPPTINNYPSRDKRTSRPPEYIVDPDDLVNTESDSSDMIDEDL
ncbi:hypothetical protein BOTBODRAFT_189057 [Botryobasidium botryosum FD-172 SS1]|uniref:SAGA-associated factor 11 n=1 Tax=Botryobasidium botryosum (strain FD-172 SS1) TaxID=930990 RepID=A0A067MAN1_BOTB1|nr:hypothetical protein BOTBODRAFT_189057 [Botryobasidium botryosum FD-172 SS1]